MFLLTLLIYTSLPNPTDLDKRANKDEQEESDVVRTQTT